MNKKVMILVVLLECVLSILLIAVLGLAIESFNKEIEAEEIHFTTAEGVVLVPGTLYKEKEGTLTEIESERIVIEVDRLDRGYHLHWLIISDNSSDKTVTFSARSQNPKEEVIVDESGYVHADYGDSPVTVTISTKNGHTASVLLMPRAMGGNSGVIDEDFFSDLFPEQEEIAPEEEALPSEEAEEQE